MASGISQLGSHPAVAMSYELFYAIIGDKNLFSADIDETWTVNTLKKCIKKEEAHKLASYDVDTLTLYKVNIDISKTDIHDKVMQQIHQSSIEVGEKMIPAFKLSRYFKEQDVPEKTIHILVELPSGESINSIDPRVWCVAETSPISSAMSTADESELIDPKAPGGPWCRLRSLRRSTDKADDPSPSETVDDNLRPHITFKLGSSGNWSYWDLARNNIFPHSGPVPGYITRLRDKLSQKRLVTEAKEVGAPGFFSFFLFLCGRGHASCTVALLGAVCGTLVRLAIGPIYSLGNSAARATH